MTTLPPILRDAEARAALYALFARLFAEEVDRPLLTRLAATLLASHWPDLAATLPEDNLDNECDRLAEEYCRLLIGPGEHISPVESIWTGAQFNTEAAARLETIHGVLGHQADWKCSLPIDHLANTLSLMSDILQRVPSLHLKVVSSPTDSDDDPSGAEQELAALSEIAAVLLNEHLHWAEDFLSALMEKSGAGFYCTVASTLREFLRDEQRTRQGSC